MLIWLILIPVIAALLIGVLKAPGKITATASAALTLLLGGWAIVSSCCPESSCSKSLSTFCGTGLQLSLNPQASPAMAPVRELQNIAGKDAQDVEAFPTSTAQEGIAPMNPAVKAQLGQLDSRSNTMMALRRIMLALTLIVTFAAVLGLKAPDKAAERSWSISALLLSAGATGAFLSDNIIAFYAFHELALIPTFVMIGCYGRGDRRTIAWEAIIYLGLASMVLLAGLVLLCEQMGSVYTFSGMLYKTVFESVSLGAPCLISGLLLLGFGTLVSLFPFHSWAAPAYASAPTPIAMLHAGVLKKFGLYGLFTLAVVFGPYCGELFGCWNNLLLLLLLGNVLWVGYVTVAQTRLDNMLGNSSVMHMGYLFLAFAAYIGLNGNNELALKGASLLMLAHGLTIAMLFLLCGQIESQTRTLELDSMGGLARRLPMLGFLFGLAGLASIGLPLLANFPGEFSIFVSCFEGWHPGTAAAYDCGLLNWVSTHLGGLGPVQLALVFALWGLVISAIYMLRAFRRTFEGDLSATAGRATQLTCSDKLAAVFLAVFIVLFGIVPGIIL